MMTKNLFGLKALFGAIATLAVLSAGPSFAEGYKCPTKITMTQSNDMIANMKTGHYSTRNTTSSPDARLTKSGAWVSQVTRQHANATGSCQVNTRVINAGGNSSLVCECADKANDVTFTVAKSIPGSKCVKTGKLGFVCTE